MNSDPTMPAYIAGGIVALLVWVNATAGEGLAGFVVRLLKAAVAGILVGAAVYAALGGLNPDKLNIGPKTPKKKKDGGDLHVMRVAPIPSPLPDLRA